MGILEGGVAKDGGVVMKALGVVNNSKGVEPSRPSDGVFMIDSFLLHDAKDHEYKVITIINIIHWNIICYKQLFNLYIDNIYMNIWVI